MRNGCVLGGSGWRADKARPSFSAKGSEIRFWRRQVAGHETAEFTELAFILMNSRQMAEKDAAFLLAQGVEHRINFLRMSRHFRLVVKNDGLDVKHAGSDPLRPDAAFVFLAVRLARHDVEFKCFALRIQPVSKCKSGVGAGAGGVADSFRFRCPFGSLAAEDEKNIAFP